MLAGDEMGTTAEVSEDSCHHHSGWVADRLVPSIPGKRPYLSRSAARRAGKEPALTCDPVKRYQTKPLTLLRAFESLTGSQTFDIMANTKSAIKAARKSKRLHDRNQSVKTRLKTLHKSFEAAAAANDAAKAKNAGIAYVSAMDKAKKSGVVHRNAAARAKAHVARYVLAK